MGISFRGVRHLLTTGRYFLLTVVMVVASVVSSVSVPDSVYAAIGSVTEYTRPTSGSILNDITVGPDNNIWYVATGPTINHRVGKLTTAGSFTEYPNPTSGFKYLKAISKGSDGNIWYSEYIPSSTTSRIVQITPTGTVLGAYTLPSSNVPLNMTLGSDGQVWYTGGSYGVGKIDTSGTVTEYLAAWGGTPTSITTGPDGNMWVTIAKAGSTAGNAIGKITTSGVATIYPLSTYNANPAGIVAGSDGNLWYTESGSTKKISKITTSGVITEYPTSYIGELVPGSDGALWYYIQSTNKIGRITTSGVMTSYDVSSTVSPSRVIAGPDGAMWYMDWSNGKIGRIATELTNQALSFTSTAPNDAAIDGPTYTPTASATSGLLVDITVDASASSVCAIDGSGKVSFQGAGTCTLNANQAGDADYNPAPQVQQSFAVKPIDADTSVSLSCPISVSVNDTVTCTITIANDGPADAENATLTAMFPSSLTGASISGGGTISGQSITWSTPSLASGASTTLTFNATASVAGRVYFNAALLQSSPDPDHSNNIASATIKTS